MGAFSSGLSFTEHTSLGQGLNIPVNYKLLLLLLHLRGTMPPFRANINEPRPLPLIHTGLPPSLAICDTTYI